MSTTRSSRFLLSLVAAGAASLFAGDAVAESGSACIGGATTLPRFGATVPANVPALVFTLPSSLAFRTLADADIQIKRGDGTAVAYTAEGSSPRFLLRPRQPLTPGPHVLSYENLCSDVRARAEVAFQVGAASDLPTALGKLELDPPARASSSGGSIEVRLDADARLVPFLATTAFTLEVRRGATVVGRVQEVSAFPGVGSVHRLSSAVSFPCAQASDSGELTVELRGDVAGRNGPALAPISATTTATCPFPEPPPPPIDGGGPDRVSPIDGSPVDGGQPGDRADPRDGTPGPADTVSLTDRAPSPPPVAVDAASAPPPPRGGGCSLGRGPASGAATAGAVLPLLFALACAARRRRRR